MQYTRRFALGAIASAVLAGCGGGGGGGDAGTGGGTTPASGGGTGGTVGNPAPQAFSAFGPTPVTVNANSFQAPAIARLAGGGNVVLWALGREIHGRLTDAAGALVGSEFVVNAGYQRSLYELDVAPTPDGGFLVAWVFETAQPNTQFSAVQAMMAKRYDASASAIWERQVSGIFYNLVHPTLEPFGDGFLLGFVANSVLPQPMDAFLLRITADGTPVGDAVQVDPAGNGGGLALEELGIAPLADGTLVAVWRRGQSSAGYTMFMRHFAPDLGAMGPAVALPASTSSTPFPIDAEGLANGNVAIAWGVTGPDTRPYVSTGVFTPSETLVAAVQSEVTELPASDVQVLQLGSGFAVGWQVVRNGPPGQQSTTAYLWRFSAAGAPSGPAEAPFGTRLTQQTSATSAFSGSGIDYAGGADGHYVVAYHEATATQAQTSIAGR